MLSLNFDLEIALKKSIITPVTVLQIGGYDGIFGNTEIITYTRVGQEGLVIGDGWEIGGFSLSPGQTPNIAFTEGTTTKITQKIEPSTGVGSSISSMTIKLIDVAGDMTRLVSPGQVFDEVIGRNATVYMGESSVPWPEGYEPIFRGVIAEVIAEPNGVLIVLNNTDERKRASIAPRVSSPLAARMDYRSGQLGDLFFENRPDVTTAVTVTLVGGGTAGSEVVSVVGGAIEVTIQDDVSTASQIRKALENDVDVQQLIEVTIEGESSEPQLVGTVSLTTDTSALLEDGSLFLSPSDDEVLRVYGIADDELFEYTAKSTNTLTGITRGAENSLIEIHDVERSVDQVLRLKGNGIDLALRLMLSKGPASYMSQLPATSLGFYQVDYPLTNGIFFQEVDLESTFGVAPGDLLSITDAIELSNNVVDAIVTEVGRLEGGSYIIVNDTLIQEISTTAKISIKSQFNTLPIGLGMRPSEVDVAQHLFVRDTFLSSFTLDIFTEEINNTKDFLDREIYKPMSCYSVPRKGRSSVVIHSAPLADYELITFDRNSVTNPDRLKVQRSISKNFYNTVLYQYDYDPITRKYITPKRYEDTASLELIPDVGVRPYEVVSRGLRTSENAGVLSELSATRWLDRYHRGAEFINGIRTNFRTAYRLEIGDNVLVDYRDLKLSDFKTGSRSGTIKVMEVVNKVVDNATGEITIDVVNTVFEFDGRFGYISPASMTLEGSTDVKLLLAQSFGTRPYERESLKWEGHIGQTVVVRTVDFSTIYTTILRGFDGNVPQGMSVDQLPAAPGEGWIIEAPVYPTSSDTQDEAFWKSRYCFHSPRVAVANSVAISETEFEVDPSDVTKFFVGSVVRIHTEDFVEDSPELVVTAIDTDTNVITISGEAGFDIDDSHYVDLIGFPDQGPAYRIL